MLLSVLSMATQQEQLQRSLQLAVTAHKAHDLATALQHYAEVLAINPSLPAIHNNMAAVSLAQGDQAGAASSWEKAVELKPDYAEAHYNLAVVLSEQGQSSLAEADHATGQTSLSRAEKHCQLALEHRPEYVQAHHLMGNILASRQQAADATASYELAAKLASAALQERASSSEEAAAAPFRWDGVSVGHKRRLRLDEGRECEMETLALSPLVLRVTGFLDADECVPPGYIGLQPGCAGLQPGCVGFQPGYMKLQPRHVRPQVRAPHRPGDAAPAGLAHDGRHPGGRAH